MRKSFYPLPVGEIAGYRNICIPVPMENNHAAAFFGALSSLGYWFNWQRDDTHAAIDASNVWRSIYESVLTAYTAGDNCDVPIEFRFNPADHHEVQYSTDGGATWPNFPNIMQYAVITDPLVSMGYERNMITTVDGSIGLTFHTTVDDPTGTAIAVTGGGSDSSVMRHDGSIQMLAETIASGDPNGTIAADVNHAGVMLVIYDSDHNPSVWICGRVGSPGSGYIWYKVFPGPTGPAGAPGSDGAIGPIPIFNDPAEIETGGSISVSLTGTGTAVDPVHLTFHNIRGATGSPGADGSIGPIPIFNDPAEIETGGSISVSLTGTGTSVDPIHLSFANLKGATGDTGATGSPGSTGGLGPGLAFPLLPGTGEGSITFKMLALAEGCFLPYLFPIGYTIHIEDVDYGWWSDYPITSPFYITQSGGSPAVTVNGYNIGRLVGVAMERSSEGELTAIGALNDAFTDYVTSTPCVYYLSENQGDTDKVFGYQLINVTITAPSPPTIGISYVHGGGPASCVVGDVITCYASPTAPGSNQIDLVFSPPDGYSSVTVEWTSGCPTARLDVNDIAWWLPPTGTGYLHKYYTQSNSCSELCTHIGESWDCLRWSSTHGSLGDPYFTFTIISLNV